MTSTRPYRPVRALGRGLSILQELNRRGSARPAELARAAGLDRTTTYRLLATLEAAGMVRSSASSDEYVLTPNVRSLSDGFTERDRTTQIVTGHLGTLFQKVLWPTDFATFDRGAMVIRETTHRFSPYSVHRAMVGQPRPLLDSALGRAALAGASAEERATMLDIYRGIRPDVSPETLDGQIAYLLDDYAQRGYGWSVGGSDKRISAIAVGVRTGGEAAAINLVFFRSASSVEAAAERFLDALRTCAAAVEASLAEPDQPSADSSAIPAIHPGTAQ